ncbi:porin [Plastoroseomonas arctica]|uniref:Porin n=1 Tax=Plastoroseomonas arctica TaxID=1509237 RepID=A0AAF1K6A0_9PROT|nr:porin [Plastoroseomonas arctica]MBR0657084.1 porin [Plastoroseomonas arctica]
MRKLLLATTAVAGAALIAPTAMAQMPIVIEPPGFMAGSGGNGTPRGSMGAVRVSLGGYFDVRAGYVSDSNDRSAVPATQAATAAAGNVGSIAGSTRTFGRQRVDFQSDFELNVFVDGKAANGLEYGAVIELQVDNVGAGATGTSIDTDEFYGYLSSPMFGTIRFGDEDAAANLLQVRVPLIRGADTDNYWDEFLQRNGGDGSPSLLTSITDGSDATKIIYLSPQFFGFDFGLSYAPNSGEGERFALGRTQQPALNTAASVAQRDRSARRNEITGAIRYRGTFGPVGLTAGFSALQSDSQQLVAAPTSLQVARRITAYAGGIQLAAFGFTVGGEYVWGDYQGVSVGLAPLARGREASRHYVLGATYTVPGLGTQIGGFWGQAIQDNGRSTSPNGTAGQDTVFGANVRDRNQTVYSFGVVHPLAPGLQLYANYTHMRDANEPNSATNNTRLDQNAARAGLQNIRNAEVYMAGFRVSF